jgi:hypothetical protein
VGYNVIYTYFVATEFTFSGYKSVAEDKNLLEPKRGERTGG